MAHRHRAHPDAGRSRGPALLQVGAAVFHGRRAEYKQWSVIAVFLAVAVFIAIVRISEGMR